MVIIGETGSGKSSLLNAIIGEMIYLPNDVLQEIGNSERLISDGEMRYLEDKLLETDLTGSSPIQMCGSRGFCE